MTTSTSPVARLAFAAGLVLLLVLGVWLWPPQEENPDSSVRPVVLGGRATGPGPELPAPATDAAPAALATAPDPVAAAPRGGPVDSPPRTPPAVSDLHLRLDVSIVDAQGRPVAGALVDVAPDTARNVFTELVALRRSQPAVSPEGVVTGTTDAQGRVLLEIDTTRVRLRAEHEHAGTSGIHRVDAETRQAVPVTLRLIPRAVVSGLVLDGSGQPLPDAAVSAEGVLSRGAAPDPVEPVMTDGAGRFTLRLDAPGSFEVEVLDHRRARVELDTQPGAVHEVTLRLPGAFRVIGLVSAPAGRSLGGVAVHARPAFMADPAVLDGEGAFELLLTEPGTVEVTVRSVSGLVQAERVVVEVTEDAPVAEVHLLLREAGTITGSVVDESGAPARVGGRGILAVDQEDWNPEPESSLASLHLHLDAADTAHVQPDGTFVLDSLHPDRAYVLTGFALGMTIEPRRASPGEHVVLRARAEPDRLPAPPKPTVIAGRVVDARTRNPITAFHVSYGHWVRGFSKGRIREVQDPQGLFRFDVSSWERAVLVEADGYPPTTVGPVPLGTPEAEALLIELERTGGLDVRVVDVSGGPAAGATVVLSHAASRESPELFNRRSVRRTDDSGALVLRDVPPGRVMLQASLGGHLSGLVFAEVRGEGVTEVVVPLTADCAPAVLEVVVLDRHGQPIEGAEVTASNMLADDLGGTEAMGRQRAAGTTDAEGRVRFEGLRAGHYWVWPRAGGFIAPGWIAVPAGVTTEARLQDELP